LSLFTGVLYSNLKAN